MRWPSAYCATSSGTSRSIMRPSTQPTRLWESRTSHQSSMVGVGIGRAGFLAGSFLLLLVLLVVALLLLEAVERDWGATAPALSAVPRFNSDSFSPDNI